MLDYGDAAAGVQIYGSDAHLPGLGATTPHDAGPVFGSAIIAYRQSGQYAAEIRAVAKAARLYLRNSVGNECSAPAPAKRCRAMVVFDIDDTLFSSYTFLAQPSVMFTYQSAGQNAAETACSLPTIVATRSLLHFAQARGVTVALITGRSAANRATTVACLTQAGITDYRYLVMRTAASAGDTAAVYKAGRRAILERAGWKIVFSIGDQPSDMFGGRAQAGFLLPNPMYMIP
jgi:acid phosphatase class B